MSNRQIMLEYSWHHTVEYWLISNIASQPWKISEQKSIKRKRWVEQQYWSCRTTSPQPAGLYITKCINSNSLTFKLQNSNGLISKLTSIQKSRSINVFPLQLPHFSLPNPVRMYNLRKFKSMPFFIPKLVFYAPLIFFSFHAIYPPSYYYLALLINLILITS